MIWPHWKRLVVGVLSASVLGLAWMPVAAADPTGDADDDIFGLITPNEQQEIWANGQRNRVILDQAGGTTDAAGALIDQYQAQGWDLESASDIVWESASGRCPEYVDAVKRAVRTYGDPS
jgi:hypothetical protein